jgi:ProP effector
VIRAAISRWVSSTRYLKALSKGGPRYGLDGQPDGEVTEAEQADALARLQQRQERYQPKAKPAAVEPQQVAA